MNKSIAALLAATLLIGTVSTACAAPPYDIDKVKVPVYGGETKGSIYVYRAFKGIDRYVNTDPMFTFYARYNAGQATAAEKKAFYSWPKAVQEQYLVDSKWLAGTRWRIELYGRVGERAWANKMAVAKGEEKPFEFIEKAYGKDVYVWIVDNRKALDAKFSAYVEGERDKLRAGLLKSDHSTPEFERIPTYWVYAYSMGLVKLEAMKRPGSSAKRKAMVDYFEYLLITDGRLYFKASDSEPRVVSSAPAAPKKNVRSTATRGDSPRNSVATPSPSPASSIPTKNAPDHVYKLKDADSLRDGYGNYLVPVTLYAGGNVYPKDLEATSRTPYPVGLYFDEAGIWNIPNGRVLKRGDADIIKIPEKYFEGMDKGAVSTLLIAFLWDEGYLRSGGAAATGGIPERYPLKNLETLSDIRSKTDEIISGADTPEDKLYAIYEWVTSTITYSRGSQNCSDGNCNGLIAFKDGHTVCGWYATLYVAMAGYAGVNVELVYDVWRAHVYVKYGELYIDPTNGKKGSTNNFLVPAIPLVSKWSRPPEPVTKSQLDNLFANWFVRFDYADYKGTPVDKLNVDRRLEGNDQFLKLLMRKYRGRKIWVSWDDVYLLAADPVVLK